MSGALDRRLGALAEAAELAEGRLEPGPVAAAQAVVRRAGERLGLGVEATVVALAGPTGAGKSTLFNALAGAELAAAGHRRPTTSAATAAVRGTAGDALLDWLEVPRRHRLDGASADGLVVLDLPDFDSVELDHRLEVERVIGLADLVVWVVDPQKYADAAWHERYLRELRAYGETMVVVLNQADVLAADALAACRADLGRLLREDGLPQVPVLTVSARTGAGVNALRGLLKQRVAARGAAVARLGADVTTAAAALRAGCDGAAAGRVGRGDRARLVDALAQAAGVPTVVAAVAAAHRRRGALRAGWPVLRGLRRLRPDPLRRLRLADRGQDAVHTSLPGPSPVQRAQVAAASRALAAGAAGALADPWPRLVRGAATGHEDALAADLDRAVGGADLGLRTPLWWGAANVVQWALAAVALAGALWLLALVGLGFLRLEDVLPLPEIAGFPLPTALLAGGALAGLLLAVLARLVNGFGARRRARTARRALHRRVEDVAAERIIGPVEAELEVHRRLCAALAVAGR